MCPHQRVFPPGPGWGPQALHPSHSKTQFIQDLAPECGLQGGVYQLWLEDFLQETALNPGHRPKSWYEGVHQPELTPASDDDTTCTLTISCLCAHRERRIG